MQQARQRDVVGPVGLAGEELGVLLAAAAAAELTPGVRLVHGLGVLVDLLGDEAGVDLLGHAVAPAGSTASWNEPRWAPSPRISEAADITALTMLT